jgi:hypothetical protein
LILFAVNYSYFKAQILSDQWAQLKSVSTLVSSSDRFYAIDNYISSRNKDTIAVTEMLYYIDALKTNAGLDGIDILYQDNEVINQISVGNNTGIVLLTDIEQSPELQLACNRVFYSGTDTSLRITTGEIQYYYFLQPVMFNLDHKYLVCSYVNLESIELVLMRYAIFNIVSFIVILFVLDLSILFATNRILIKPILGIEKIVDSFVYQVSGGYMTYYFNGSHGNELVFLKNSVKRLEKLIGAHNNQIEASDRYINWQQDHIDKLNVENSSLLFDLKSVQFEALCDKETLIGNTVAWTKKCIEIDHLIDHNSIDFLQLVYLKIDATESPAQFIDDLLVDIGINVGIPMEKAFRLNTDSFVFVFDEDNSLYLIINFIKTRKAKVSHVDYEQGKYKSVEEMLVLCKEILGE